MVADSEHDPIAAKPTGRKRPREASNKKLALVWTLATVPLALVLWPTCLVLGISLIPTLIACFMDRDRGKHLAVCIGLANFVGALPALADLWEMGQNYEAAVSLLRDGLTWVLPYGAAAAGYLVYYATELSISTYYRFTTEERLRYVHRRQKTLIDEWGMAVVRPEYMEFRPPEDEDEDPDEAQTEAETVYS